MSNKNEHGREQEENDQSYALSIIMNISNWILHIIVILFIVWILLTLATWLVPNPYGSNPTLKEVIENQIEYIKSKKIK